MLKKSGDFPVDVSIKSRMFRTKASQMSMCAGCGGRHECLTGEETYVDKSLPKRHVRLTGK